MKNKLIGVIMLIFTIMIIFNVSSAAGALENACYPSIKLVNQDPYPATPGSYVKVLFSISGLENPFCKGMSIKLEPEYPFSLNPGDTGIKTMSGSTFIAGSVSNWNIPFKLQIAPDAFEGDYKLKLTYRMDTDVNNDNYDLQQNFNVTITDAQTDFDTVIQGTSGTQMSLGIVNIGKNTANSLVVSIPTQENFRAIDINQQIVGNLAVGDYTIVSFNINPKNIPNVSKTNPNVPSTNQEPIKSFTPFNQESKNLQIKIDYTDGIGKRRSVLKEMPVSGSLLSGNLTGRMQGQTKSTTNIGLLSYFSGLPDWALLSGIIVLLLIAIIIGYKKGKGSRKAIICGDKVSTENKLGKLPKMFNTEKNQKK